MLGNGGSIRELEPLWGNWFVNGKLGEGGYGSVYRIVRHDTGGTYYSACKHIAIPKNESEIANARANQMDNAAIYVYFENTVKNITSEIEIMHRMRGEPNIVAYEDHQILHRPGALRWDILIRMELLIPLSAYLQSNSFALQEVRRLGVELCSALEVCAAYKIIHRDIKEANVFLNGRGTFKLGDFGIAREAANDSMSMRGTPAYIAPEVYNAKQYDLRVDIYSLGILMYKLLNRGRHPFLPAAPRPFTADDEEKAFMRRISGEPLPEPMEGDLALKEAVLMACEHDPRERFQSASAFKRALMERPSGAMERHI